MRNPRKGCHRSAPAGCIFLELTIQLITLRTPCPQIHLVFFCYGSEINRFYSSYKSVTKATVLMSIINIPNSSSPQQDQPAGLLPWKLRSLVLRSWAPNTHVLNETLSTTWPLRTKFLKQELILQHICHLYKAPIPVSSKILKISLLSEACLNHVL